MLFLYKNFSYNFCLFVYMQRRLAIVAVERELVLTSALKWVVCIIFILYLDSYQRYQYPVITIISSLWQTKFFKNSKVRRALQEGEEMSDDYDRPAKLRRQIDDTDDALPIHSDSSFTLPGIPIVSRPSEFVVFCLFLSYVFEPNIDEIRLSCTD